MKFEKYKGAKAVPITKTYSAPVPDGVTVLWDGYSGECQKEDTELIIFVDWFKFKFPHYSHLIMHIPNESMKPVQGRIMDQRKGLLDGAPDILIFLPSVVVAMEFKRADLKQSLKSTKDRQHFDRQLMILSGISKAGAKCSVVCGADAGKYFINSLAIA